MINWPENSEAPVILAGTSEIMVENDWQHTSCIQEGLGCWEPMAKQHWGKSWGIPLNISTPWEMPEANLVLPTFFPN